MYDLRRTPNLVAFAILLTLAPSLTANDRNDRERTKRIEYLIDMLASKNRAPVIRGNARRGQDQTITFRDDYDRSLQVPVYLAVKELLAEDEVVIDLLLAHEGDERYSFSVNDYIDWNVTVSGACMWIAERKLLAYEPELHVITHSQFGLYPLEDPFQEGSWKAWWMKNRQRGLAALQVEAIDAQIKFMTTVDGETALPWHPDAQRLPLEEFNRRRNTNLQTLRAIRHYIVASGQAYRPKSLNDDRPYFFGLPWTGRRHNK